MDQGDTEKVAKVTENLFPGTQNLFFPGIQNLFFPETQNLFFPGTKNLFPGIQNLFSRANLIRRERGGGGFRQTCCRKSKEIPFPITGITRFWDVWGGRPFGLKMDNRLIDRQSYGCPFMCLEIVKLYIFCGKLKSKMM